MEREFGGLGARLIAFIIDNVAIAIISIVVAVIFGGFTGIMAAGENWFMSWLAGTSAIIMVVTLFLLQFLYFGWFWSQDGQSVGMKIANIHVVRRSGGGNVSFIRGALRGTLGYYISGLVFYLGYIWAIFDSNREAWHDKLFDTWVLKGPPPINQ